jgi:hypothetical protein
MDESQRILKLLEDRKITADEAARLLDALGDGGGAGAGSAKFLKVRVYDKSSGHAKVNVTLPVGLVRWGLQFMPESARIQLNEHHVDFEQVVDALNQGFSGKLVDVESEEGNERVEVYLE